MRYALIHVVGAVIAAALAGCGPVGTARRIVEAQAPGAATGAGATLTGPANSAAPSTQTAKRTMAFRPPSLAPNRADLPPVEVETPFPIRPAPISAPLAIPAWVQEEVTTTLGQHQDAAAILKVAATLNGWNTTRWLGLLAVIVGVGGLLHSAGHNEGYPLCWIKTTVIGAVLVIVGNPWLLLLGLIPLGFYMAQKLGLLRIPGIFPTP